MSKLASDIERELEAWCKVILDYTKERVENDSPATRWIFDKATHDEWVLSLFPKHLASIEAYNQFFELTGKDIRDYDWNSTARTKTGTTIIVHKLFVDEHLTTAHDFKYELISLYKKGELTLRKIKELISMQRLCWITKAENDRLTLNGFRTHREDPVEAYKCCGIEFYDEKNEDLTNVMKPTFQGMANKGKIGNLAKDEILNKLKTYFENNLINNKKFVLMFKQNEAYAWIYKSRDFMINTRVKNGKFKDICLYIDGDRAKQRFATLLIKKDEIEDKLGYQLVWDKNEEKKAVRIGRFFKDADLSSSFELKNQDVCFDFNIDDFNCIENTAYELANFYNVFLPIIENME